MRGASSRSRRERSDGARKELSRRSFLETAAGGVGIAVALAAAWGAGRFALFARGAQKIREVSGKVVERLKPRVPTHVRAAAAWLVRLKPGGQVIALDDRCPHLGCRPRWDAQRRVFLCPCHGSEFDREGKVIKGPAVRAMTRLSLRKTDDGDYRLVQPR